jgi:hypothetical protein
MAIELQRRVIADRQACVQEPASSQVTRPSSLVSVLVWPKIARAAGQPGSLGREATAGAVPRRESTRLVRDRSCGTVGHDAIVAGQEPERYVGETAIVIAGRSGRVRASSASLLVVGSNTVRTCVQGFGPLRDARKSVTCGDCDLRVQEHRSAAERGCKARRSFGSLPARRSTARPTSTSGCASAALTLRRRRRCRPSTRRSPSCFTPMSRSAAARG